MKKLHFCIVSLLAALCVACGTEKFPADLEQEVKHSPHFISQEKALENLRNFEATMPIATRSLNRTIKTCKPYSPDMTPATRNEDPAFYVVNYDNDEGFAILAATDLLPEVLADTESGSLYPEGIVDNPGMMIFLDQLVQYTSLLPPDIFVPIDTIDFGDQPHTVYSEWRIGVDRGPYCPMPWHQESPYNLLCPSVYGKAHGYAGCAPVAFGLVMTYHKYPMHYINPITQTIEYTFNWNEMKNDTYMTCSESTQYLLEILGRMQNLDATYTSNWTGVNLIDTAKLEAHFAHTMSNFRYERPQSCAYDSLIVENQLRQGLPVIASGEPNKSTWDNQNGHFWVIDGFRQYDRDKKVVINTDTGVLILSSVTQSLKYIHCNWGWGNDANGYFYNGVFDLNQSQKYPNNTQKQLTYKENIGILYNIKNKTTALIPL